MADLVTAGEVTTAVPSLTGSADLSALITAASLAVENYCNRVFEQVAVTETHDGGDAPFLFLRRPPIASVATVTINGTALDNTGGDAWSFNANTGELVRGDGRDHPRFSSCWPAGVQNVTVLYTGGYATVPGPVKRAVILQVKYLSDLSANSGAYKAESIGDYSYTLGDITIHGLSPAAAAILSGYVRHNVM